MQRIKCMRNDHKQRIEFSQLVGCGFVGKSFRNCSKVNRSFSEDELEVPSREQFDENL